MRPIAGPAPSLADLRDHVAAGLVAEDRVGRLSLFNYTNRCTFSRGWDEVTIEARGLLIDTESGDVVARPWPKFFNHGEPEAVIPSGIPDEVSVKEDGVLAILYPDGGSGRITTRGKLHSPPALMATSVWAERYGAASAPSDWTILMEAVGPSFRILIDYPEDDFVVLGARRISTGEDIARELVAEWAVDVGVRSVATEPVEPLAKMVSRAASLPYTREGWVLRWGSHRVKVKGADYLNLARIAKGLTRDGVRRRWAKGEDVLVPGLPEEMRADVESWIAECEDAVVKAKKETQRLLSSVRGFERRQQVRLIGVKHWLFGAAMSELNGKPHDWRRTVAKQWEEA